MVGERKRTVRHARRHFGMRHEVSSAAIRMEVTREATQYSSQLTSGRCFGLCRLSSDPPPTVPSGLDAGVHACRASRAVRRASGRGKTGGTVGWFAGTAREDSLCQDGEEAWKSNSSADSQSESIRDADREAARVVGHAEDASELPLNHGRFGSYESGLPTGTYSA